LRRKSALRKEQDWRETREKLHAGERLQFESSLCSVTTTSCSLSLSLFSSLLQARKSRSPLAVHRQYLPIFIYELAQTCIHFKVQDRKAPSSADIAFVKRILNQIVSKRFSAVYLCMHFPPQRRLFADRSSEREHNFNTNSFTLCFCCTALWDVNADTSRSFFQANAIHFTGCILLLERISSPFRYDGSFDGSRGRDVLMHVFWR
jgi:hypothetical protein